MSELTKVYASEEYVDSKIPEPIGWNTTGKSYYYDGTSYVAKDGAITLNKESNYSAGQYAVAEGYTTKALGDYSHAEGFNSVAKGQDSHAEGQSTKAKGLDSHAEGRYTEAEGAYSHAEGEYTTASKFHQHVQGKYNVIDSGPSMDHAHIVGNGTAVNARSNAHTLDWSGNAWFSGDVYTGSTSGTNKDDGSKKLSTEEYVDTALQNLIIVSSTEPTVQEGKIWLKPVE